MALELQHRAGMKTVLLWFVVAAGCARGGATSADSHAGRGNVAGGVIAKSARYKLIGTLSSGHGNAVVGATQP